MPARPLVSIVMPAYNAEPFIAEAITSLLGQTYPHWELLVVDDGSTDGTAAALDRFTDPRIRRFQQTNRGPGSARNRALEHVRGDFLAFLDADDVLPSRSLEARVDLLLSRPELSIADGAVQIVLSDLKRVIRTHQPAFTGAPLPDLVTLSGRSFAGITWMLRWEVGSPLRFPERTKHAEDFAFFIRYAGDRLYGATQEDVLLYRTTGRSSMNDLGGLDRAYQQVAAWLVRDRRYASWRQAMTFVYRSRRAMVGAYWHKSRYVDALQAASWGVLSIGRYLRRANNPFQQSVIP